MQRRLQGGGVRVGCQRGGYAPYGWGAPELSLNPAQVSPSRDLQGSSCENQPVLWGLLARVGPAEARVWPGALSGSLGKAAPCCAQACLAPSPQPWQPSFGACIVATFPPDLRSQALAEGRQPQDREGNQVQGPSFPRIRAPSHPLSIPLWGLALPWLPAVGPKQEVGGLWSRGQG